jgi:hypothetical protein
MCSTSLAFVCKILVKKASPVPSSNIIIRATGRSKVAVKASGHSESVGELLREGLAKIGTYCTLI